MKKITLLTYCLLIFASPAYSQTRITMKKEGGVYTVPCTVNGLKLRFVLDTGASDVSISMSEAIFMLKNGYLEAEDFVGSGKAMTADGSIIENTKIILREVEIGGLMLKDIEASVVHNIEAPLLLGQSAIEKLGKIEIDGNKLVISNVTQIDGNRTNAKESGNSWVEVTRSDDYKCEIHVPSMERDGNFVTYWEKRTYLSELIRKKDIDWQVESSMKYDGLSLSEAKRKWNNFSYLMTKIRDNCKNATYVNLSLIYYDKEGKVIASYHFSASEQKPKSIVPGTYGEDIHEFVKTFMNLY